VTRSTPGVVGATQLEWVGESASTLHLIMNDGEWVSHTGWSGTLQGLGTGCVGGSELYKEFMCA